MMLCKYVRMYSVLSLKLALVVDSRSRLNHFHDSHDFHLYVKYKSFEYEVVINGISKLRLAGNKIRFGGSRLGFVKVSITGKMASLCYRHLHKTKLENVW